MKMGNVIGVVGSRTWRSATREEHSPVALTTCRPRRLQAARRAT